MGGLELSRDITPGTVDPDQIRAAAVHVADRVAAEHPHLTAMEIAANPSIVAGFLELLDQLGLCKAFTEISRLQDREVQLEANLIVATDLNQRLKEGQ